MLQVPLFALLLGGFVAATPFSTASRGYCSIPTAPLIQGLHPHLTVPNSYIVVFKDQVGDLAFENHLNFVRRAISECPLSGADSGLKQVYNGPVKGYAGKMSEVTIDAIRCRPEVDYVEVDQIAATAEEQPDAPWGLARISHRKTPTSPHYHYDKRGGEGVDVYVIDSGINLHHIEFEGRATWGTTIPDDEIDDDHLGHGTHVAGIIASRTYGVAKAANLISVKVFSRYRNTSASDIVGGVSWATLKALVKREESENEFAATGKSNHKGSVVNMSLRSPESRAINDAVNRATTLGIHFAVAAGNDNRRACEFSPASAELALTVGASTINDKRWDFSNYGKCVDVFAPGHEIISTFIGSVHATKVLSGTSMASPHAAGLLAYLLSIYPSETFNPARGSLADQLAAAMQPSAISSVFRVLYGIIPDRVFTFLPLPKFVGVRASGPVTLEPLELKKALLALSTPRALKGLYNGTANLLIFNNASAH